MIQSSLEQVLEEIQSIPKIAEELLKLPHYKKLGFEKICVIIEAARNMGIKPQRALSGGFYVLREGKIEIGYRLLNEIIISRGHEIKLLQDTPDICELEGIRKDTRSSQRASFSMEDAKRAGLIRPGPWMQYPQDMLYARALSRLGRRHFSDIITSNTYVEGELERAPAPPMVDALAELKTSFSTEGFEEEKKGDER